MAEIWNGLLDGLGAILSFFYNLIPSYGFAIVLLTIAVRMILLPLTIKQTRSMHAMQKVQPQIKEIQRKYKGDRQKLNEEMMKIYKEHRVNPLGGCLPLLLQLPVFFALFQVLRNAAEAMGSLPGTSHLPAGSQLLADIQARSANFLSMNLACTPTSAGRSLFEVVPGAPPINCGDGVLGAIPYYLLVVLLVATTWYQTKQMQATSPQQAQMKLMSRIMPAFLGLISLSISSGVLVYWVTTNSWQIGQQYVMLRSRVESAPSGMAKPREAAEKSSGDGEVQGQSASSAGLVAGEESGSGGVHPYQRKRGRRARGRKKRRKR
ncbi:MAG: YidC/Oxa1 family membrane protein insertase [Actinomycetota bacterium]